MANECNPSHGYWTYQRLMKERQTPHWWHTPVAPGCLNHFNCRLCMPSTSGSCLSSWNLSLNSAINCPLVCSLLFQSEYRKTGKSTPPRSWSSTRTTLPRMPSQANCPGVLVTPEQFSKIWNHIICKSQQRHNLEALPGQANTGWSTGYDGKYPVYFEGLLHSMIIE